MTNNSFTQNFYNNIINDNDSNDDDNDDKSKLFNFKNVTIIIG